MCVSDPPLPGWGTRQKNFSVQTSLTVCAMRVKRHSKGLPKYPKVNLQQNFVTLSSSVTKVHVTGAETATGYVKYHFWLRSISSHISWRIWIGIWKLVKYVEREQKPLTDGMLLGFKCHPKCSNNIKLDPLLPNGYGLWDKTLIIKA